MPWVMLRILKMIYWELNKAKIIPVTKETLLAICTVQIILDFKGKYNAMNFSTEMMTSNATE